MKRFKYCLLHSEERSPAARLKKHDTSEAKIETPTQLSQSLFFCVQFTDDDDDIEGPDAGLGGDIGWKQVGHYITPPKAVSV